MIAFLIQLENKPGTVADAAELVAGKGINVISGAGIGYGDSGQMVMVTNDEAATRHTLQTNGYSFREVEIVPLTLQDSPGSFARACRSLADAGINIDAAFPMAGGSERNTVAFATSEPTRARAILGQMSEISAS